MNQTATRDPCCDDPCCSGDCAAGARNRYFIGKRLTPASFSAEQRYHLERRHLLNRAIHGWGVVYGMGVTLADEKVRPGVLRIDAGLALDRAGRELIVVEARDLRHGDVKVLDPATKADADGACWLLSAHYAERRIQRVAVSDECHCERDEWDQVCEDVVFSLRRIDCAACCPGEPCSLDCACVGDCESPLHPHNRGPHGCLCTHLTGLAVGAQIDTLCKFDACTAADLRNGVALACVTLKDDGCGGHDFDRVSDACGPRRLVKRNDLLFDLIRGCDLTVIDAISWADWHRRDDPPVPFDDFSRRFSVDETPPERCITTFSVHFSRPVRIDCLRPDAFSFTVVGPEEKTGWGDPLRVPIVAIEPGEVAGELASLATLVVDGEWFTDEMRRKGRHWSAFRDDVSQVEIEVRGDYLIDCNGQAVDANAVGRRAAPSGNGTPGGTFISTFDVAPTDGRSDGNPKY